ncbi:hypothetical protein MMC13_000303 [Lambiella insularis]|nr:hypothetical protein [Lambiella insularis]
MPPPTPAFGSLRVASPEDTTRIGIVATSGFIFSPVCTWYRPYLSRYTTDALESYLQIFLDYIRSPQHVVLVASDKYDPLEGTKTGDITIRSEAIGETHRAAGEEVVVGFQNDSGTFPQQQGLLPTTTETAQETIQKFHEAGAAINMKSTTKLCASEHTQRSKSISTLTYFHKCLRSEFDSVYRYFDGISELEMLVVHPAYWGRGHGGDLVK